MKYKVFTRQTIEQTWEYEIDVPDALASSDDPEAFIDYLYEHLDSVPGHCLDDDAVIDEKILDWERED